MKILTDQTIKILVVDDQVESRELLVDILSKEGILVESVGDGLEAICKAEREDFDIVLTDLMMPKVNGIEVLKAVKKKKSDVLIIIITGYGSLDTAMESIKMGAHDYITKPFKLQEMETVVKNAVENVRLRRENKNLIEELKDTYVEIAILKDSQRELDEKLAIIKKRMEEKQTKIAEGLCSLQNNFPEVPLPMHYKQRRRDDKGYVLVELEKLGKLRSDKIISDNEFNSYKSKLLSKL